MLLSAAKALLATSKAVVMWCMNMMKDVEDGMFGNDVGDLSTEHTYKEHIYSRAMSMPGVLNMRLKRPTIDLSISAAMDFLTNK